MPTPPTCTSTPGSVVPLSHETSVALAPVGRSRFLSEADCHDITQRLARYAAGGGGVSVHMVSRWAGFVRWARNHITTAGEDRDNQLRVMRDVSGRYNNYLDDSPGIVEWNDVSDAAIIAAARRAERLAQLNWIKPELDLLDRPDSPWHYTDEPTAIPSLFSEATYNLDADHRAAAAEHLMQTAKAAGMYAAGYIEVSATSFAWLTSAGYTQYFEYTWAKFSTTVRDPKGVGSGWAGVDWPDWGKINGEQLVATALDKCLKSRNPVAVEPGRYTTILEPQAVAGLLQWFAFMPDSYHGSDLTLPPLVTAQPSNLSDVSHLASPIGTKIIDERLSVTSDPSDPMLSFPPYLMQQDLPGNWYIFHPISLIEHGVIKHDATDIATEPASGWKKHGDPSLSYAYHLSTDGPTQSVEEMIADTKRGLLVTRFDAVLPLGRSALVTGVTRDGVWLIENGKLSHPVKNLRFVEDGIAVLNRVDQIGVSQRTFNPGFGGMFDWLMNPRPGVVPALKVRDFSFTALTDAI